MTPKPLLTFVLMTAISACAASQSTKHYAPRRSVFTAPPDAMFQEVQKYIRESGWSLHYLAREQGTIVAVTRASFDGSIDTRERWSFRIIGRELEVHRRFEARFEEDGQWTTEHAVCASYAYTREQQVLSEILAPHPSRRLASTRP